MKKKYRGKIHLFVGKKKESSPVVFADMKKSGPGLETRFYWNPRAVLEMLNIDKHVDTCHRDWQYIYILYYIHWDLIQQSLFSFYNFVISSNMK